MTMASPALPLRGHTRSFDASPGLDEVKVDKTANEILNRMEMHLSKEALLERHARHLTKHFMKMGENWEQEKLEKEAEQSRILHERVLEKARHISEAQAVQGQLDREQRSQIFELMQDQHQQKLDEQRQVREAQEERDKWVQARTLYQQIDLERRLKLRETRDTKLQDELDKKVHAHEAATKKAEVEKKDKMRERLEREQKRASEAETRRRERGAKARAEAVNNREKLQQAEQRRQQRAEESVKSAREAAQRKEQMFREQKQKADQELEEKRDKLIEKVLADRQRTGANHEPETANRQSEQPTLQDDLSRSKSSLAGDQGQEMTKQPKAAQPSIYYYCTPRVGKELGDANVRAQKEYVRRLHDLEQDKRLMLTSKKYKDLAETAKTIGDKFEGGYTRKLRSVHKMYLDTKQKSQSQPPSSDAQGSSTSSQASPRQPPTHRRQRCALCEREMPWEALEGRAMRKVVERFREQMPALMREGSRWAQGRGGVFVGKATLERVSALPEFNGSETKSERSGDDHDLYDYEVRTCMACWHYMRVRNA